MCAHPRLPSFQAAQARNATLATTMTITVDRILLVSMPRSLGIVSMAATGVKGGEADDRAVET
jgi:hypothetical protein